jgi:hypothetical protein
MPLSSHIFCPTLAVKVSGIRKSSGVNIARVDLRCLAKRIPGSEALERSHARKFVDQNRDIENNAEIFSSEVIR